MVVGMWVVFGFFLPSVRPPPSEKERGRKCRGISRSREPGREFALKMEFGSSCGAKTRIGQFWGFIERRIIRIILLGLSLLLRKTTESDPVFYVVA